MEESERERGRKENMRCKVSSFLSPHVESKLKKKSVDFSKLRLEKSLDNLIVCFNNRNAHEVMSVA